MKQFEIKGEIPDRLETEWASPLVVRQVAPRDWPPRGWEVDREELEFIREGHKLQGVRVNLEDLENGVGVDEENMCLERYKVFLKQYEEWVEANKDRLEEESYEVVFQMMGGREFFIWALFYSGADKVLKYTNACCFCFVLLMLVIQEDQNYYPGRRKRGKDYKEGMVG